MANKEKIKCPHCHKGWATKVRMEDRKLWKIQCNYCTKYFELKKPMVKDKTVDTTTKKQRGGVTGKGFMPGQSGNPAGRPVGSLSITTAVRRRLEECRKKGDKNELERLVDTIMKKAIEEGDNVTIKTLWAYVDGLPKQAIDITTLGEKITGFNYVKPDEANNNTNN